MARAIQGDRILIPSIDVEEGFDGARIPGSWFVDQGSTLLLLLEIEDAITLTDDIDFATEGASFGRTAVALVVVWLKFSAISMLLKFLRFVVY
jgi:hypothetical protein